MNAPLPESVRKALETVTLDDKYALDSGRAFMSGVQALVRLPMLQRARDVRAGLNTAGFISGYRGSPLGGYDQALWAAKKHLEANHIVFQPGVNEELGATAVWGTQQMDLYPQGAKYDGVFGIWYGKGPGVDRCSDVFKHANMAGTSRHGGVIAIAADDHVSKSSTAPHQSDHIFKACGLPVFFPSNVQDILDMGLHAIAMSRFSGVWSGMKTIQEVVESSSSVIVDPDRVKIVMPEDFVMPPGGLHIRWPDAPLEQEARLMDYKWYAALAYVRANKLNYNVIENRKGYSCWSREDPGCGFVIWKSKAGKTMPPVVVRELIQTGQTAKQVTGFKGRSGRSFRAKLALMQNEEGRWRVEFDEAWAKEGAKPPEGEDAGEGAAVAPAAGVAPAVAGGAVEAA